MGTQERVLQRRADAQRIERYNRENRISRQMPDMKRYDEYGDMWLTEDQYAQLQGADNAFGEDMVKKRAALKEAAAKIKSLEGSLNKQWADTKSGFVPVNVVTGNNVEGTYYLPKSIVDMLNTEKFNQGEGSYTGTYQDDGKYYVDTNIAGIDERYGKELHEALGEASNEVKTRWYDKYGKELKSLTKDYRSQLAASEDALKMQEAAQEEAKQELVTSQREQQQRANETLSGLEVRSKKSMLEGI